MDFNPQFQSPDPSYLKYSKASGTPESDKSLGIALTTAASGISESVELADSQIKSSIRNDISDYVTKRRDQFNNQLDNLIGGKPANPSNPLNANASMDLMPDNTKAPADVDKGLDAVARLQAAKEQNGRFRTTSLDADIYARLKQIRSDWPGYRDYIDEQGSKIVGYNVANKLVSDKLAQLNELAQNTKSEADKVENFIRSHSNVTGMENVMANYKAGKISDIDVYRWGGAADQKKEELNNFMLGAQAEQAAVNLGQLRAGKIGSANQEAGEAIVNHFFNDSFTSSRLVQGKDPTKTDAEIHQLMVDIAADPSKYPGDEQMEMLRNTHEAIRADATAKAHALIFTPSPKTGKSIADVWGADNANDYIKKMSEATFGTTSNFFSKKDFSLIESNQRRVAAATSDANLKLVTGPVGSEALLSKAVANDPAMSGVVSNKILTSQGFTGKLNNLVESQVMRAATQFDLARKGKPNTISEDVGVIKDQAKGSLAEKAVAVQTLSDVYKVVTDKKTSDQSKLNAMTYLFDKSNEGVLQKISPEGIGADGQPTKGQIDFFESITNKKLSEEAWALSQRTGNKDIWNKYTKLAQHEFGVKMTTDIRNFDNLQDTSSLYGQQWHYAYDNDLKQFYSLHADGTHLTTPEQNWLNPAWRLIDVVNRGLENIRYMAEVSKAPPDAVDSFIFSTLEQAGWSPKKEVDGVPAKMMNAILLANGTYKDESETKKDAPKRPKPPISQ